MGCFGSKPRVARLAMAPAYPGQGDFRTRTTSRRRSLSTRPRSTPARDDFGACVLSAPARLPAGAGSRAVRPPDGTRTRRGRLLRPLPTVVPPRAAPPPPAPIPSAPLRHVLGLDATRVGWLAAPDANKVQDYTKRREVIHTGHMLDARGDRAGVICDITPHAIDPAEGLPLSGKATFGSYVTDDHEPVTLGCVEISPKFFSVSGSR